MRTKQEKQELEQTISTLEGEIAGLRLRHRSWDRTQREALNILDIKGSMCFMLRVKFGYFFKWKYYYKGKWFDFCKSWHVLIFVTMKDWIFFFSGIIIIIGKWIEFYYSAGIYLFHFNMAIWELCLGLVFGLLY